MSNPVAAHVRGNNADLIEKVCDLYAPAGSRIADLTYGKGVFWRRVQDRELTIVGSDIKTVPERPYDMRNTPYLPDSFDIVVIDPPYIHSPGNHVTDANYQNAATTKGMLHDDIRQLYVDGMAEAKRIVKPDGGQIWVKCKDQVQSSMQRWAHCEMLADALNLGLIGRDLFILIPDSQTPKGRWKVQHHARKQHSFLWVFERPRFKTTSQIVRENLTETMAPKGRSK